MREDQFPHAGVGPTAMHPELFIRDVDFLNYHFNHDKWNVIKNWDIQDTVRWFDDFTFREVDLYTTAASAGGGTAIADMINGVMVMTPHTDDDDYVEEAADAEAWQLVNGYPLYFECRVKIADAVDSDFYAGLINSAGYFSAKGTDGVMFWKPDGAASLFVRCTYNSVDTDVDTGYDMVNATWVRLAFHWDGDGNLRWFVFTDGNAPQACAYAGVITTGYAQDELFNVAWGVRNGAGAAKLAYIDYYKVAMRRNT